MMSLSSSPPPPGAASERGLLNNFWNIILRWRQKREGERELNLFGLFPETLKRFRWKLGGGGLSKYMSKMHTVYPSSLHVKWRGFLLRRRVTRTGFWLQCITTKRSSSPVQNFWEDNLTWNLHWIRHETRSIRASLPWNQRDTFFLTKSTRKQPSSTGRWVLLKDFQHMPLLYRARQKGASKVALILFLALPGCSLANSHAFSPISVHWHRWRFGCESALGWSLKQFHLPIK